MKEHPQFAAYVALICVCFFWGTTYLGFRIALDSIGPATIVCVRNLISGVLLLTWARSRRLAIPRDGDLWRTGLFGVITVGVGTTLEEAANAIHAKATISMQEFCTEKTLATIAEHGQEVVAFNHPVGITGTDRFLQAVSRITGKAIPEALTKERGRLVDAIADSAAHIHGKKFAIYGDPDLCYGLAEFILELGGEPTHILATNGNKAWEAKVQALLDSSPFGVGCKVYAGKDLWHLRSLLFTAPVDFMIGNGELDIDGERPDGSVEALMRAGEWSVAV